MMKITPKQALDLTSEASGSIESAKRFLLTWLNAGEIKADAAITKKSNGTRVKGKIIPAGAWKIFKNNCPQSLWEGGTVNYESEEYIGIKFNKAQFEKVLEDHPPESDTPTTADPVKQKNGSGRNAGFHGEVIAAVTVRYLLADEATYAAKSFPDLLQDLSDEYRRLKVTPLGARNLAQCARGIIQIVKSNRSKIIREI